MPQLTSAVVAVYDFGAPAALAQVVCFRVLRGGKVKLNIVNTDTDGHAMTVTLQTAPGVGNLEQDMAYKIANGGTGKTSDSLNWTTVSVAKQGAVVSGVSIPSNTDKEYEIDLNAVVANGKGNTLPTGDISLNYGGDAYFQLLASGGVRGQLQIRGGEKLLEILNI